MEKLSTNKIIQALENKPDNTNQLDEVFHAFTARILPELKIAASEAYKRNNNVYQTAGAKKLSSANALTRTYSTKLGLLWEEIADLAPNVISPELDFGVKYKIPDVDVIVRYNGHLYYTQLKTQKNTLTGSQAPRTLAELGKYDYHWFVACIDNNSPWTFSDKKHRLIGKEFWNKIGIDYDEIVVQLGQSIQAVETLLS